MAVPPNSLSRPLVRDYKRALDGLVDPPDLIVPAAVPFEGIQAALEYAEANPDTQVIPLLFDHFADSPTLNRYAWLKRMKFRGNLTWEREMLSKSDAVLQVHWTEHVNRYHGSVATPIHRVEHPMVIMNPLPRSSLDTGRMVYAGSLNDKVRDPRYALELLRALGPNTGLKIVELYVPGHERYLGENLLPEGGHPEIRFSAPVTHEAISRILADASWLLSIGNTVATQMPSKTYEYMSLGKPIVHISLIENDPVESVLARYPLGIVLRSSKSIVHNAVRLGEFLHETKSCQVDFELVERNFHRETPSYVAAQLLSAARDARTGKAGLS